MNIIIRQARLIDPAQQLDKVQDVHLADGIIQAIGQDLQADGAEIIDAQGQWLTPAFTDLLSYLRQPGNSQKGTIATETQAAASAGFTHVAASPDTQPTSDSTAVLELIQDRAEHAGNCQVSPIGALTQSLQGQHLSNMQGLTKAGAVAFSNAGHDIANNTVLMRCYEYAATYGLQIFVQAWDADLGTGHMHSGALATRLGLNGIPEVAETLAISRHLQIMQHTGVRGHFQQLSSAAGVQLIRQAKAQGLPVSADVDIAHLSFTEQQVDGYASQYHVMPPLRRDADRQALLTGLADGTIDAIVSAHQPHEAAAKQAPFGDTAVGMAVYDMFVPLLVQLINSGELTPEQAISALTTQASAIISQPTSGLQVGHTANLCLLNPSLDWQLSDKLQQSYGANQCLAEQTLQGRTTLTISAGNITWRC